MDDAHSSARSSGLYFRLATFLLVFLNRWRDLYYACKKHAKQYWIDPNNIESIHIIRFNAIALSMMLDVGLYLRYYIKSYIINIWK